MANNKGCYGRIREKLGKGGQYTAYKMARKIGCSPQHANRLLRLMWVRGEVGFHVERRGQVEKRVWGDMVCVRHTFLDHCWQVAERGNGK